MPAKRSGVTVLALAIAVIATAPYVQVVGHDFVNFDDHRYVLDNPHVSSGLTIDNLSWALTATHASNWHPLTWMSHMLDCELFDLDPGAHHAVNVLLHAANAALLFLALSLLTEDRWPSALAAALFAVHPLRVESVAWISERKDVLAGLCFMLGLLAYAAYRQRPGPGRYAALLACLALGLAAKPTLVSFPLVLLLLDIWPLRRWLFVSGRDGLSLWRLGLEKLPLAVLSLVSCVITVQAQRGGGAVPAFDVIPLGARIGNAAAAYLAYLWDTMWPAGLACFYPHPALVATGTTTASTGVALGAVVLLAGLTWAALCALQRRPHVTVGWLWYLLTLVPVIGLVQVGSQARADRYTYLPLVGIFLIVSWTTVEWARRRPAWRIVSIVATTVVLAVFVALSAIQTGYWKDTRTLFERALSVTHDNYLAHTRLGVESLEVGDLSGARAHFDSALRIAPRYARAHHGLAGVLLAQGDTRAARSHYESALRFDPRHAESHYNLGLLLKQGGDLDGAAEHYRQAIRIRPDYGLAHNNLGNVEFERGDLQSAAHHYRRALDIDPGHLTARNNLGLVLEQLGQLDRAAEQFAMAARLDPADAGARIGLGRVAARRGDWQRAAEYYERAVALSTVPEPALLEALAAAYAEAGQPTKAVEWQLRALRSMPAEHGAAARERLERYRAGGSRH